VSEGAIGLPLFWGGHGGDGARTGDACWEAREAWIRAVEYCPYPRASARGWRVGFLRDGSTPGTCLEVDRELPIGSLLRLTLPRIDGRPTSDSLARVASCREGEGGWRVGLEWLEPRRPALARVRRAAVAPRRRSA
jgi:hypothetical protein